MKTPLVDLVVGLLVGMALAVLTAEFCAVYRWRRYPPTADLMTGCVDVDKWAVWADAEAILREAAGE